MQPLNDKAKFKFSTQQFVEHLECKKQLIAGSLFVCVYFVKLLLEKGLFLVSEQIDSQQKLKQRIEIYVNSNMNGTYLGGSSPPHVNTKKCLKSLITNQQKLNMKQHLFPMKIFALLMYVQLKNSQICLNQSIQQDQKHLSSRKCILQEYSTCHGSLYNSINSIRNIY